MTVKQYQERNSKSSAKSNNTLAEFTHRDDGGHVTVTTSKQRGWQLILVKHRAPGSTPKQIPQIVVNEQWTKEQQEAAYALMKRLAKAFAEQSVTLMEATSQINKSPDHETTSS